MMNRKVLKIHSIAALCLCAIFSKVLPGADHPLIPPLSSTKVRAECGPDLSKFSGSSFFVEEHRSSSPRFINREKIAELMVQSGFNVVDAKLHAIGGENEVWRVRLDDGTFRAVLTPIPSNKHGVERLKRQQSMRELITGKRDLHSKRTRPLDSQLDSSGDLMILPWLPDSIHSQLSNPAFFGPTAEPRFLLDLMDSLTEQIELLHQSEIRHGDIKSKNIALETVVDNNGAISMVPHLMDFGLASHKEGYFWHSMPGVSPRRGTNYFLSREALFGDPHSLRIDLDPLRNVFAEMLTGRPMSEFKPEIGSFTRDVTVSNLTSRTFVKSLESYPDELSEQHRVHPVLALVVHHRAENAREIREVIGAAQFALEASDLKTRALLSPSLVANKSTREVQTLSFLKLYERDVLTPRLKKDPSYVVMLANQIVTSPTLSANFERMWDSEPELKKLIIREVETFRELQKNHRPNARQSF